MYRILAACASQFFFIALTCAQQLPVDQVWSYGVQEASPLCSPWIASDGTANVFLAQGTTAILIHDGERVWQSRNLGGQVTAANRFDFGLEDGPRWVFSVIRGNNGWLVEYVEATQEEVGDYELPFLEQHVENMVTYDNRKVSHLIAIPPSRPDSSRTIMIANTRMSYFHSSQYSGRMILYSLHDSTLHSELETGFLNDYFPFEGANGQEGYLLLTEKFQFTLEGGRHLWGQIHLREVSLELLGRRSLTISNYNYYDIYQNPSYVCGFLNEDETFSIFGSSVYHGEQPLESNSSAYCLSWPPDGATYFDSIYCSKAVAYQARGGGNRYALLTKGDSIGVYSFDRRRFEGVLGGFPGQKNMWTLISRDGVRDLLMVLTNQWLTLYRLGALDVIENSSGSYPSNQVMLNTFPNPFNSSTTISYTLPRAGHYTLTITDITGREVARLAEGWKEAGSYREVWEADHNQSGIYFATLKSNLHQRTLTLVITK